MTTILVLHDEQTVDEFEFDADVRTVTIGRRPSNDVCIQDRSVSGTHARLSVREDGTWLEDLGSTNGTWLDGDAVTEQRLEDGDEVLLGKVRLRVHVLDPWREDDAPAAPASEAVPPVVRRAPDAVGGAPAVDGVHDALQSDPDDEDSFVEQSLRVADDDDDLDESMRRALELYGGDDDDDDEESEPVPTARAPAFDVDDDEPDFAEDARLFAQPVPHDDALALEPEPGLDVETVEADGDDSGSLSDRAKAALGRQPAPRPRLRAVDSPPVPSRVDVEPLAADARAPAAGTASNGRSASSGTARAAGAGARGAANGARTAAPARDEARPRPERRALATDDESPAPTHELDRPSARSRGAVIQIKNGAKSGQILPIDKPVTTLGRPGIQIAAIMRKPDGYFLMHIESDDAVDRPTLNADSIGDEPVLLHSGDELNVAGIDVEFMLS